MHTLVAGGWLAAWLVAGYVFSIAFTAVFRSMAYEPNVARVGCWLGASLWVLLVVFHVCERILMLAIPTAILVIVIMLIVLAGIIVFITRRTRSV